MEEEEKEEQRDKGVGRWGRVGLKRRKNKRSRKRRIWREEEEIEEGEVEEEEEEHCGTEGTSSICRFDWACPSFAGYTRISLVPHCLNQNTRADTHETIACAHA